MIGDRFDGAVRGGSIGRSVVAVPFEAFGAVLGSVNQARVIVADLAG
jgi:hypothetical protein